MHASYEIAGCPACGSEAGEQVAGADEIRAELEALWAFHTRRLRLGTPVPHLQDRVVFSQPPALRLAACADCGTVFRNPREESESVVELYEDEAPDEEALEDLYRTQCSAYASQAGRLTRLAGGCGHGLEIGSYVGGFLAAAERLGWRFEGVDVNAPATRFARTRGYRVRQGTIEDAAAEGTTGYDAVAFWNCFDQLPDPRTAAAAARTVLRPGGLVAIRVPNGRFYARWRTRLRGPLAPLARALLSYNNLLGFPYRHGFTPGSLGRLLEGAGFEVVWTFGDTLVPLADRWTRPWAALEERLVKALLRGRRAGPAEMPWFEIYARAA